MASGAWRACAPAAAMISARAAAAAVAAALTAQLAGSAVLAAAPSPTPAPPAVESVQDTSLEAIGVSTQALYGRSSSVAAFFPPPAGPLAPRDSLLRLVFEHSPLLDAAASAAMALVNGQELGTVAMDAATVNGGVADLRVPARSLHGDRANLVEVRFDLRLAGRTATSADDLSAFVRLENQTLLRYQLYVAPGGPPAARLDAYPFPLVAAHGPGPARLGLVLPDPPEPADLAAGFRLVADLGRRGAGQQVAPEVVTGGQLSWLRAAGLPALVVGGERRLPAAEPLLRAAGFALGSRGWTSPDGEDVAPGDGVVAAVTSPWDRRSPIVLATGDSDDAVGRAAAALAAPANLLAGGTFALVHAGAALPAAPAGPAPGATLSFPALGDQGVQVQGAGQRSVSLAFAAPAVDPAGVGDLELAVSHTPVPPGRRGRLTALVNGTAVGAVPLGRDNEQARTARIAVPGSTLRPGRNALTLAFELAGDGASAGVAPDARLRLPGAPPPGAGLELLPHPVFDDPAGVRLVLGGADDAILTGAARVVAALGGRATATPRLTASYAGSALGGGSLLVVGVPGASPAAARVASAAGLPAAPPPAAGAPPTGVVRELATGRHPVLWVDGTGAAALALAGDALARGQLAGSGAAIDGAGHIRALAAAPAPAGEPGSVTAVKGLIAVAACLLVAGVAWQAWRPRREEG